jgi:hypothetical protein
MRIEMQIIVAATAGLACSALGHPQEGARTRHEHHADQIQVAAPLGAPQPAPFTVVAYPDTQYYSENAAWTRHFTAQTQWTKDWNAPFNIAFATHLGDIVNNGASISVEWVRADAAIDILDTILPNGMFPYGVCLGNHDFNVVSDKNSGSGVYDQYFGPDRYAGRPWYVGFSPDRQNHAQLFTAGGRTFLHLTLEWRPDAATFFWAQTMINRFAHMPTICSTHEHVNDANTSGTGAGRSVAGQSTWTNLIRTNSQIFMFLNGHFASGVPNHNGEHAIVGINAAGREVLEMLSDYQAWTEGGSGYMRLIRVDERNSMITFRTYSPSTLLYQTDWNSQFRYAFDFPNRFDGAPPCFTTITVRAGCQDTELNSATPSVANGAAGLLTISNADGTPAGPTHSLIRFDDLFGTGPAQIPPYKDVLLAKLKLVVTDSGSGLSGHEMLQPWSESSTWNSLTAGVSADGIEAASAPVAVAGAAVNDELLPIQAIELDVTRSIRAYMNGAPNYGWALLPFAVPNGIELVSSESTDLLSRPQLIITMPVESVSVTSFQQGVNGYAGTRDTELRESAPTTPGGTATSMFIDSSDPNGSNQVRQGLLRFDGIFGSTAGQVPVGSRVTSAMLELTVSEEGSGFTLHRVRTGWAESSTWASLTAGVSANDTEAFRWPEQAVGREADGPFVKPGLLRLDVTDSVQAWERGETNLGWLIQPRSAGVNGLRIESGQSATASSRPRLVVRYIAPVFCLSDFTRDGAVDGDDVIAYLEAWDAGNLSADLNGDDSVDGDDVIAFFAAWDAGC